MSIRAILRNGQIQPLDPLPSDWADGQELLVEPPDHVPMKAELEQWSRDVDEAAAQIDPEEHERLRRALEEIERESKDATRREWGLK